MANLKAGRPVYMHCVYGADRTGMLALLIEGMLGISYDHMAKDYELTSMSNWSGVRLKTRYFDSIIRYMNRFSGSTVQERIVSFLKSRVKMTNEEIDYLRSELLEDTEQKSNDGGLTTSVEQPIQAAKSQSTAYDLTNDHTLGEHATTANGKGLPSDEDLITVGTAIRITRQRCMEIIKQVKPIAQDLLCQISKIRVG